MNFVGHAVVAGRERSEPAFAFGAMVPDLQRMARQPLAVADDALAAGIEAHHRADAAFHGAETFKHWMRVVVDGMETDTRGARAAAHVAVELAIDGHLLTTGAARAYDDALAWAGDELGGTWAVLVDRMRTGEVVDAYATADGIAERVVGVMRRRRRLEPITPDARDLASGVRAVLPSIAAGVDDVVELVSRARG